MKRQSLHNWDVVRIQYLLTAIALKFRLLSVRVASGVSVSNRKMSVEICRQVNTVFQTISRRLRRLDRLPPS
jgi:hypothetical protein